MKSAPAVSANKIALQGEALAAGASPPTEIEVILSGQYKVRGLNIDEKAIDEMILNHQRAGVDPAVDREHESWSFLQLEPSPAMGWVKALSKRPSAADPSRMALVAQVEWTDAGAAAVAAKHWRYISAGLDLKAKDRLTGKDIGVQLDHVALVKHPFVQGMQPLSLSHSPEEHGEPPMNKFTLAALAALGLPADADESTALSALDARGKDDKERADKLAARDVEVNALKQGLAALQEAAKADRLARLTAALDAKIEAFAVDPSEREALLKLAASSPEAFTELLALRQPRDPGGPKLKLAKAPVTDRAALQRKAIDEHMKAFNCDMDEAIIQLAAMNPSLFEGEVA